MFDIGARVGLIGQPLGNRVRRDDPMVPQDSLRLGAGRRVRDGGPRCDDPGIVAGRIGNRQGHEPRRPGGLAQPAALDQRQMLSNAVDFGDRRSAAKQRPDHRLLVAQQDPRRRGDQQRRAAARQ